MLGQLSVLQPPDRRQSVRFKFQNPTGDLVSHQTKPVCVAGHAETQIPGKANVRNTRLQGPTQMTS